ncbi:uncharacterized protein FIBRA_07896 [Fibroporia radiculosa]|uniref:Ricin B lectin domain-containing protein n=1 Tax=Fibroporia radiculosa TaxID=599839 RepID=J4IC24_9APHY|nr:uncharacterized protein FIBRA_07896 [Fibroporia radiculosa]CCM05666.1 predicted protein [Fibroporia radiculosa]
MPSNDRGVDLVCIVPPMESTVEEEGKWELVAHFNDRYKIKNCRHNYYCRAPYPSIDGSSIVGDEFYGTFWFLEKVNTGRREHTGNVYIIRDYVNPNLCWSLEDANDRSPISLREYTPVPNKLWRIEKYSSQSPVTPDYFPSGYTPGTDITALLSCDDYYPPGFSWEKSIA